MGGKFVQINVGMKSSQVGCLSRMDIENKTIVL